METPDIQVFNEMLNKAISIWSTYDDTYGYASEKINYIKSLTNVQDNAMVFYKMFDHFNQSKFLENISSAAFTYIQNNQ